MRASTVVYMTTYLDIQAPPASIDAKRLAPFWREETERWLTAYYTLTEEIESLNPFRDPHHAEALRIELAAIAENVAESASELVQWTGTQE